MADIAALSGAVQRQASLSGMAPVRSGALAGLRADRQFAGGAVFVRTFGGVLVSGGAGSVGSLPGARQRHLLRWLVLAPWGPPLEVAAVCDGMWPEADGAAAASNFASAVRRLRQTLGGATAVIVDSGTVRLNPACCSCDLDALRQSGITAPAGAVARMLVESLRGENPVLLAPPDNEDMARRIQAVGVGWRHRTVRLLHRLQADAEAGLAMQLCESIDRHGMADAGIMELWRRLAADPRHG